MPERAKTLECGCLKPSQQVKVLQCFLMLTKGRYCRIAGYWAVGRRVIPFKGRIQSCNLPHVDRLVIVHHSAAAPHKAAAHEVSATPMPNCTHRSAASHCLQTPTAQLLPLKRLLPNRSAPPQPSAGPSCLYTHTHIHTPLCCCPSRGCCPSDQRHLQSYTTTLEAGQALLGLSCYWLACIGKYGIEH
eukprot:876200-Pelagomonas_calceolata.AAC.3